MPAVEDWLNRPQEIVQCIFEESGLSECHKKVVDYFASRINQGSSKNMIPSLNDAHVQSLKADTLVRFRCMIQDMFDPEYFLGAYEVMDSISTRKTVKCGLYKDIANCQSYEEINYDSQRNVTYDRLSYYCISVPGESQWVKEIYSKKDFLPSSPCASTSTIPVRSKRSFEDSSYCCEEMEDVMMPQQEERGSKRSRSSPQTPAHSGMEQFPEMNFPLPGMVGKACIVKLYDQSLDLKMNDVVEFIGILSIDPAVSVLQAESDENYASSFLHDHESLEELQAHNPPASLVPRLHVIIAHRLDHNNPCVPRNLQNNKVSDGNEQLASQCSMLREELLPILTDMFLGDRLVAEYFLCHLISSVYVRHDIVALGKFCLNIMNIPVSVNYPEKLYCMISSMVTQSHLLPLSLENVNNLTFVPSKNYTTNRLTTGLLQLSNNTHLVVDETALMAGQLSGKGLKNMAALGNLIQWQRVEYDFDFHKVDYLTDIPVLILSEGKSLLPNDFIVALHHSATPEDIERTYQKVKYSLNGNVLPRIRDYLTYVKLARYDFSSDLQKVVENDFVEMRRTGQPITADDLHSLLVLARLLSVSMGQMTLNVETWEKAKFMEMTRKCRLPVVPSN